MPTKQDKSIRKAAIFVQGLDKKSAETLYARMSATEAAQLRQAVRKIGAVDEQEHSSVIDELRQSKDQQVKHRSSLIDDREGVALEIGSAAIHGPIQSTNTRINLPNDPHEWFSCIGQAEPAAVASYLSSEQPRTIGLVLSYISPDLAAKVLAEFSEDQQTKILLQLASLGEADPTSVRVLATGLSNWIKRQGQEKIVRASRMSSVQAILSAVPNSNRKAIVEKLQEQEPLLDLNPSKEITVSLSDLQDENSNQVTQPSTKQSSKPKRTRSQLSFSRIHNADADTLTMALATMQNRNALLALVEADEKLVGKIKSKMPRKLAKSFEQRLMKFAPASLEEIEHAKNEFALAVEKILIIRKRTINKK